MQTHKLKTLPPYWDAVRRGEKTFEVRRDDRGFQKGDILELIRHAGGYESNIALRNDLPDTFGPGGRYDKETCTLRFRITYVLTGGQFGIEPGYVVLGIAPQEEPDGR